MALAAGTGKGVRYVRYTMLTTQGQDAGPHCVPGDPTLGCFISSTELAVYGKAAA